MNQGGLSDSAIARLFALILQYRAPPPPNALDKTLDFKAKAAIYQALTLIGKDRTRCPPAEAGKAYLSLSLWLIAGVRKSNGGQYGPESRIEAA